MSFAQARTKPLPNPYEFRVNGISTEHVERGVRHALRGGHWTITEAAPQKIQARLFSQGRSVSIAVRWTESKVDIDYLGSENMEYGVEDGHPVINRYYIRWMKKLHKHTARYMRIEARRVKAGLPIEDVADNDSDDEDMDDDKESGTVRNEQ